MITPAAVAAPLRPSRLRATAFALLGLGNCLATVVIARWEEVFSATTGGDAPVAD